MGKIPIALQLYTVRDDLAENPVQTIQKVSEIGYQGVEGADSAIRAAAGVGLIWASPFGPLRVNYAHPFMKEDYDETQQFSFGFSSRF